MEVEPQETTVRASDVYHRLGRMEALVEAQAASQVLLRQALADAERQMRSEFSGSFTELKDSLERRLAESVKRTAEAHERLTVLEAWRSRGAGRGSTLLWLGGATLTLLAAVVGVALDVGDKPDPPLNASPSTSDGNLCPLTPKP